MSKMKYCADNRKGVPTKPLAITKVYMHKSASYPAVLKKSRISCMAVLNIPPVCIIWLTKLDSLFVLMGQSSYKTRMGVTGLWSGLLKHTWLSAT